jgi:formate hydrogenlyase subunit 6/NADH:ubiquinone oxidoreductase subunit I
MVKKKVVLIFPPELTDKAITYRLVKDFDLAINILRAKVTPQEEGRLLVELSNGDETLLVQGLEYLREQGVGVQLLSQDIQWNENLCVHCGACTAVCFAKAFVLDPKSLKVSFDCDKCIACELCINTCPVQAIQGEF